MPIFTPFSLQTGGGLATPDRRYEMTGPECHLFLGLGSCGISCIRKIKDQVVSTIQPDSDSSGEIRYSKIRFMGITADPEEAGYYRKSNSIRDLSKEEIYVLDSRHIKELPAYLYQNPCFSWLNRDKEMFVRYLHSRLPGDNPYGTNRQFSRLCFMLNSDTVFAMLRNLLDQFGSNSIHIHLFVSLGNCGSSGYFLDICYILRYLLSSRRNSSHISGYLFLPDLRRQFFPSQNQEFLRLVSAGYAALQELDYCMHFPENGGSFSQVYLNSIPIPWNRPPFDLCNLVNTCNRAYGRLGNVYEETLDKAAQYAFSFLTCPELLADFTNNPENIENNRYRIIGSAISELPVRELNTLIFSKVLLQCRDQIAPLRDQNYRLIQSRFQDRFWHKTSYSGSANELLLRLHSSYQGDYPAPDDSVKKTLDSSGENIYSFFRDQTAKRREQLKTASYRMQDASESSSLYANLVDVLLDSDLTELVTFDAICDYLESSRPGGFSETIDQIRMENRKRLEDLGSIMDSAEQQYQDAFQDLLHSFILTKNQHLRTFIDAVREAEKIRLEIQERQELDKILIRLKEQVSSLLKELKSSQALLRDLYDTADANQKYLRELFQRPETGKMQYLFSGSGQSLEHMADLYIKTIQSESSPLSASARPTGDTLDSLFPKSVQLTGDTLDSSLPVSARLTRRILELSVNHQPSYIIHSEIFGLLNEMTGCLSMEERTETERRVAFPIRARELFHILMEEKQEDLPLLQIYEQLNRICTSDSPLQAEPNRRVPDQPVTKFLLPEDFLENAKTLDPDSLRRISSRISVETASEQKRFALLWNISEDTLADIRECVSAEMASINAESLPDQSKGLYSYENADLSLPISDWHQLPRLTPSGQAAREETTRTGRDLAESSDAADLAESSDITDLAESESSDIADLAESESSDIADLAESESSDSVDSAASSAFGRTENRKAADLAEEPGTQFDPERIDLYLSIGYQSALDDLNTFTFSAADRRQIMERYGTLFTANKEGKMIPVYPNDLQQIAYLLYLIDHNLITPEHQPLTLYQTAPEDQQDTSSGEDRDPDAKATGNDSLSDAGNDPAANAGNDPAAGAGDDLSLAAGDASSDQKSPSDPQAKPDDTDLELAVLSVSQAFENWLIQRAARDGHEVALISHAQRQGTGEQYGYDVGLRFLFDGEPYSLNFECKHYTTYDTENDEKAKALPIAKYAYNFLEYYMSCDRSCCNHWILVCPYGNVHNGHQKDFIEQWNREHSFMHFHVFSQSETLITCREFLSTVPEAFCRVYGKQPEWNEQNLQNTQPEQNQYNRQNTQLEQNQYNRQNTQPEQNLLNNQNLQNELQNRDQIFERFYCQILSQESIQQAYEKKMAQYSFWDSYRMHPALLEVRTLEGENSFEKIREHLENSQEKGLFIIGEFGTGKSWLTYRFVEMCCREPVRYPYIPIYKELKKNTLNRINQRGIRTDDIRDASDRFVTEILDQYKDLLTQPPVRKKLVFILDGFDEVLSGFSATDNKILFLYQVYSRLRREKPQALFLITSRESDYIACRNQDYFKKIINNFDKLQLVDCDPAETRTQILQLAQDSFDPDIRQHLNELSESRDFLRIMTRPVFLGFLKILAGEMHLDRTYTDEFDILDDMLYHVTKKEKQSQESDREKIKRMQQKLMDYAVNSTKTIDSGELELEIDDAFEDLFVGIVRVRKTTDTYRREHRYLSFPHNIIREFLVAKQLFTCMKHAMVQTSSGQPIFAASEEFLTMLKEVPLTYVIKDYFLKHIEHDKEEIESTDYGKDGIDVSTEKSGNDREGGRAEEYRSKREGGRADEYGSKREGGRAEEYGSKREGGRAEEYGSRREGGRADEYRSRREGGRAEEYGSKREGGRAEEYRSDREDRQKYYEFLLRLLQEKEVKQCEEYAGPLFSILLMPGHVLGNENRRQLNLDGLHLSDLVLWNCEIRNCSFHNAKLHNLGLFNVRLDHLDFRDADLTGLKISSGKKILTAGTRRFGNHWYLSCMNENRQILEYQLKNPDTPEQYEIRIAVDSMDSSFDRYYCAEDQYIPYSSSKLLFPEKKLYNLGQDTKLIRIQPGKDPCIIYHTGSPSGIADLSSIKTSGSPGTPVDQNSIKTSGSPGTPANPDIIKTPGSSSGITDSSYVMSQANPSALNPAMLQANPSDLNHAISRDFSLCVCYQNDKTLISYPLSEQQGETLQILNRKLLYLDNRILTLIEDGRKMQLLTLEETDQTFALYEDQEQILNIYIKAPETIRHYRYLHSDQDLMMRELPIRGSLPGICKGIHHMYRNSQNTDYFCAYDEENLYVITLGQQEAESHILQSKIQCQNLLLENPDHSRRMRDDQAYQTLKH